MIYIRCTICYWLVTWDITNHQSDIAAFLIYELRTVVYNWVRKCDNCGSNKPPVKTPCVPMCDMRVGPAMDRWATDILGPYYALVVTDAFSKWTEAFGIPDQKANTCMCTILNEMISRFGYPLDILSGQGRNYESDLFKELNVRKIPPAFVDPRLMELWNVSIKR